MNDLVIILLIVLVISFLGFVWRRTLGPIEQQLANKVFPTNTLYGKIQNAYYVFNIKYWYIGVILMLVILLVAYYKEII
jgi:hypothetical protein